MHSFVDREIVGDSGDKFTRDVSCLRISMQIALGSDGHFWQGRVIGFYIVIKNASVDFIYYALCSHDKYLLRYILIQSG